MIFFPIPVDSTSKLSLVNNISVLEFPLFPKYVSSLYITPLEGHMELSLEGQGIVQAQSRQNHV